MTCEVDELLNVAQDVMDKMDQTDKIPDLWEILAKVARGEILNWLI